MTKETVKHKVVIDKNLSVDMLIPVELTAIELKALMVKASKLFNLSDTSLGMTQTYTNNAYSRWTTEEEQIVKDNYKKLKPMEIAKMLPNRKPKTIYPKIYALQKAGELKNGRK